MKQYLVTVKVDPMLGHNPHAKRTGYCPIKPDKVCTDVTGAHHTVLWSGESVDDAKTNWLQLGYHVTRVEEA